MAKVYSSQNGVMRGRVGSTVYRKGQNATTASQYQPQVTNPKSDAQCVQRAAFNTAVQAQSALASIVNHSHKSLSGKRANLQRFVKDNTERIRAIILKDYEGENVPEALMNLKGVSGIQPAPYKVSEGSLAFRPTKFVGTGDAAEAGIDISGTISAGINSQETYVEVLRKMGIAPGDQLSLIIIVSAGEVAGSYNPYSSKVYNNYQCHVLASRVTFISQIPEGFSGTLTTDNKWNPALVVTEEGDMTIGDGTSTSVLALTDGRIMDGEKIVAAVVVRSALDENNKFDYSNGVMVARQLDPFDMGPKWAAQSYGNGQSVRLGDQPFLDNPIEGSSTGLSVASIDANVPLILAVGEETNLSLSGISELPQSLYISAKVNGETAVESSDIMSASVNDTIASISGNLLKLTTEPDISETTMNIGFTPTGGDFLILGGHGTLADGTPFVLGNA